MLKTHFAFIFMVSSFILNYFQRKSYRFPFMQITFSQHEDTILIFQFEFDLWFLLIKILLKSILSSYFFVSGSSFISGTFSSDCVGREGFEDFRDFEGLVDLDDFAESEELEELDDSFEAETAENIKDEVAGPLTMSHSL